MTNVLLLGSLPNSHRHIEPELMRRLMAETQINDIISSGIGTRGLEFVSNRPSVGSLSDTSEFSTDEMYRFLMNSRNIIDSPITGSEEFPGQLLRPQVENIRLGDQVHDLLVEYFSSTYVNAIFRKPFAEEIPNSSIVLDKANKYGKCQIGAEIFGSVYSPRNIKSSFILAKFMNRDGRSVDIYPGQVQYFFEHNIFMPFTGNLTHKLAFVRWYKPANSSSIRYHFSINDDAGTCNVELWENSFYPISRDNIIPIHNILGRFVPVKYKISERSNSKEYLAIIPLNRKFHLR